MNRSALSQFAILAGACLLVAPFATEAAAPAGKWSYSGKTGAENWSKLEKDYAQCKDGQFQSPIDIPDGKTRKGDFPPMLFVYKPTPVRLADDGRTIRAAYAPGSGFTVADKRYELVEINFHKPSEQKIDGRSHDMEAHLVHKGPGGKTAVVAVLLDRGNENPAIKTLWDNLPKGKDSESASDATISAVDLLPGDKGYYSFAGSLTTPPCSEDVTWFVFKSPVQLSPAQIARFEKLYPMNARPVQPLNGRDVAATP